MAEMDLPEIDYLSPEECELLLSHANGIMREPGSDGAADGYAAGRAPWPSVVVYRLAHAHTWRLDILGRLPEMLVAPKNNRTRNIPLTSTCTRCLYGARRTPRSCFWASRRLPVQQLSNELCDPQYSVGRLGLEQSAGTTLAPRSPLTWQCAEYHYRQSRN